MKLHLILLSLLALAAVSPAATAANDERSFFDGLEARSIGPFRGGRAMTVAGVRQQPHVYYMGTTGGVWKTSNAGASWEPVSDDDFGSSAVGAIAVAPSDPNVIVVGMGESPFRNIASSQGDGVYKSTDAGKTWQHLGFANVRQIGEIRIHPDDPDTIWVAAQGDTYKPADDGGVFKSVDGGKSWRRVLTPLNNSTGAVDLALDMSNPRILYAALWDNQRTAWALRSGGPGSGIWRSSDGGENWQRLSDDLPDGMGKIGVAASAAKPGLVWAIIEAEGDKGGLYRSDDGGDSWSQVNKDRVLRARSWYYMHVFADPNNADTVYVLNAPFMKSIDGGKTFTKVSVPHGDNHYLWINPDNSNWLVNANDGGGNVSLDGGASWSRQDNQPTAQFYRVNADKDFEYRVYGGQQDNSTVAIRSRSRDGAIGRDDWEVHGGCESAHVAFDVTNPRYTYAGCYLGMISEFDTETRTARSIKAYEEMGLGQPSAEYKYRFNWNAPIHVSVHDSKVIYHAGNVLLKSIDRGFNWQAISPDLTRNEKDKQGKGAGPYTNENAEVYNTIFALAESPHDANELWVGSDDGLLHLTRDGGKTWDNVSPRGLDRAMINSIDLSAHEPGVAYLVAMKYKEGDHAPYVWRTKNHGRSWQKISAGLPQEHFARVVREDSERRGLLFAGMERGLFVSFDDGDNWKSLQLNLPVIPVTDLLVRNGDLVMSTQGRGFWIIDDIAPLRQYAETQRTVRAHLYSATPAYRLTPTQGSNGGGASFAPSAPKGAVLYYALAKDADLENESITLEVRDGEGRLIRTLKTSADKGLEGGGSGVAYALPAEKGINRAVWDLRTAPTVTVNYPFIMGGSGGVNAVAGYVVGPGEYSLRLKHGDTSSESKLIVRWDPINDYDVARINAQQTLSREALQMIDGLYRRINTLDDLEQQVELRKALAEKAEDEKLVDSAATLLTAMETWRNSVTSPERSNFQDVLHFPPQLDTFLTVVYQNIDDAILGVTQGQRDRLNDLRPQWNTVIAAWDKLVEEQIKPFNEIAGPAVLIPSWQNPDQ